MWRKTIVSGIALSLASTSALAAPVRVPATIAQSEGLAGGEESAWILPVGAIVVVALIVLLDSDGDDDRPTSP